VGGPGLLLSRAHLRRAAQDIVARHGGEFPSDFDSILALPGIGRYTAGAILSIAFENPIRRRRQRDPRLRAPVRPARAAPRTRPSPKKYGRAPKK